MNIQEFDSNVLRLENAFKKKYPSEAKTGMYARLRGWPTKAMSVAVEELVLEERFLPPFSKLYATMKHVCLARAWATPETQRPTPPPNCRRCEDTGIKLRRNRVDLLADFYCDCPASKSIPHYDWSTGSWRLAIERDGKWRDPFETRLRNEDPDEAAKVAPYLDDLPF